MKKVVLDTNITLSAFFWRGYPRKLYDLIRSGKIIMISSIKIEEEFIRVLGYPKFGLSPADWRLIGNGVGIHWEEIDEDISVSGLLA